MGKKTLFLGLFLWLSVVLVGCGKEAQIDVSEAPGLVDGAGVFQVEIVIPQGSGVAVKAAAEDMAAAMQGMVGVGVGAKIVEGGLGRATRENVVLVEVSDRFDAELGEQGYTLFSGRLADDRRGVRVRGRTEVAAMYGLYHVIGDLGVRYHHPEETFIPARADAVLPWAYDGSNSLPRFARRGFHEHTQHPTVMSDYYLRPSAEHRAYVSNYIRWFARNRQNAMSWHMLKTVELESWLPYIEGIIEEAHGYGIDVGMVLSFVDEQQNNFKIVDMERYDGDGKVIAPLEQIEMVLTEFSDRGFDFYAFQIGSSEFTKPDEAEMLSWLNLATALLKEREKPVKSYAWIHTTCSLKAEDGSYYYHLPEQASEDLGAWVHTTMFYPLNLPAPVYDCEDFTHNLGFMERQNQKREQVYFPETAWWLGFDNNTPITMPVTGWSREHDIRNVLSAYDVNGHITFTTGREWMYWQYDHYLMGSTWDGELSWADYLEWIGPMYGARGETLVEVIKDWTELQVQHFYEDNPEIYFYVAGELRQDEIGAQAGILARRPKVSYSTVIEMNPRDFENWKRDDFDMLVRMRGEYGLLLERLEVSAGRGETLSENLYHEAYTIHEVFVRRLDHTIAIYSAVQKVRAYNELRRAAVKAETEVDAEERARLLGEALVLLEEAQGISAAVIEIVADIEHLYRYPLDILAREKPESLTGYPFGYLYQTHTGHFWTRRDEQLDRLIALYFETVPETWQTEPEMLFVSGKEGTSVTKPAHPMAQSVISSFVPQMLFGLNGVEEGTDTVIIGQDFNENLMPDLDTEASVLMARAENVWTGALDSYEIVVHDSAGFIMGTLVLLDAAVVMTLDVQEGDGFQKGEVVFEGQTSSQAMVQMVMSVGGIDVAGASNLLKAVFGIPTTEPLPALLDVGFQFEIARHGD